VVLAAADTMPAAVTASVGVVGRVHNYASHAWADSLVPVSSGFADFDVLMLFVADRADRRVAIYADQPDFTAGEF
jgi:hypothetical protein